MSEAIELRGLRRDFGERTALNDVELELAAGETLVVLGPNGAGKTTLLRILATLLRPTAGEPRVLGARLPGEAWKVRGRIGFLGHEPLLYRDLSGRENLRFQARLHGLRGDVAEQRIAVLLDAAGMERNADRRVAELSAGMRQRLAICRCVLHEPELLLLDEPESHLDAEGREAARELIGPAEGRTRVLVTHEPERALPDADQVLELGDGRQGGDRVTPSRLAFAAILGKDLRAELRTLQSLPAMALFAVTTFVIFRFGLDRTSLSGSLGAGVLWATLLFAAILGINRLFVAEREEGGFDAIRLAPIDRTALFAAKAAALLVYLLVLEAIVVPVFAIFFLGSAAALPPVAAVLLLADLGLAATGTLISSMAVNSRARDLLVPLVLLPLAVPLSIAATGALEPLLAVGGPGYHRFGTWLAVLGLYDLVFLLAGYAVFDFLLED